MAEEILGGKEPMEVIREYLADHQRIIFNGDGYSAEWEKEAERRGLPNNKTTIEAAQCLKSEKAIELFTKHDVYNDVELKSRYDILLEGYCKTLRVEALTALKMAKTEIYPAVVKYIGNVAKDARELQELSIDNVFLKENLTELSALATKMKAEMAALEKAIDEADHNDADIKEQALCWRDSVLASMNKLRKTADTLETMVDQNDWPIPSYVDLLFGI